MATTLSTVSELPINPTLPTIPTLQTNPSLSTEDFNPFPLLITGVAGVAGYNAWHYFRRKYPAPGQVIGVRQSSPSHFSHHSSESSSCTDPLDLVTCDVCSDEALSQLFDRYKFRSVIHSGGTCALKPCQLNPELAWNMNVSSQTAILHQCEIWNCRLIMLSVDLVYKGRPEGERYVETDPSDAVSVYGQTMSAAEQLILLSRPASTVLRISLPIGLSGTGHAGAIDWIASRFRPGRHATLFTDEFRTPTLCSDINRVFEAILFRPQPLPGIFHCGQPRPVSLYQCGQIINRLGDYNPDLLYGIRTDEGCPIPPRASNVTMDSSKLIAALGFNPFTPWPNDPLLVPTDRFWHYERPENELRGELQLPRLWET